LVFHFSALYHDEKSNVKHKFQSHIY